MLNASCALLISDKYQGILLSFLILEKEHGNCEIERMCYLSQDSIPKVLLRGSVGEL